MGLFLLPHTVVRLTMCSSVCCMLCCGCYIIAGALVFDSRRVLVAWCSVISPAPIRHRHTTTQYYSAYTVFQ